MKTDFSPFGNIEKTKNNPLISQDDSVLSGFTHTKFFNNNYTNCMNNLTINNKRKVDFSILRSSKKSYYSSKGLRILMILGLFLFSISMFGQITGDYRSATTGDWTSRTSWERYDGASWNTPTLAEGYPGQFFPSNSVIIVDGDVISLDADIPEVISTVVVGDGSGSNETLDISGTSGLNLFLLLINSDGVASWSSNVTLTLPSQASIKIFSGGDVDGSPCSAAKRIEIGTTIISTCIGGANAIYDFDELVAAGGASISGDSDSDGIADYTDLDDDNDGILDEEEYCSDLNTPLLPSSDSGTRTVVVNHSSTGYARLDFDSLDNSFQLDINGTTIHNSVLEFEDGAKDPGDLYFRFLDNTFITQPWIAHSTGLPRIRLIIDENGIVSLFGTRTITSSTLAIFGKLVLLL